MAERVDPANMYWCGRRVTDMGREELLELIAYMQFQFDRSAENFNALAEANQNLLDFNQRLICTYGGSA